MHRAAVFGQRGIGRHLLEELRIEAVVIVVEVPAVEGQGCYGGLVADVKDGMIVGMVIAAEPDEFGGSGRTVRMEPHLFRMQRIMVLMVTVEMVQAGVGKADDLLVLSVDIGKIGTVGPVLGGRKLFFHARSLEAAESSEGQCDKQLYDGAALPDGWQTESMGFPSVGLILAVERANPEEAACLAVFLDDTAAVFQPEAKAFFLGLFRDGAVGDAQFYVVIGLGGLDEGRASGSRKLAGIVGKGVEHEEGQGAVGFDDGVGGSQLQADMLVGKAGFCLSDQVEQWLQMKTLDMEHEVPLFHLYPIGKHLVGCVDLTGQFRDILPSGLVGF